MELLVHAESSLVINGTVGPLASEVQLDARPTGD